MMSGTFDAATLEDDDAPTLQFDESEFRIVAARYIKRLIRARWKTNPDFLTEEELRRWKLDNIADDSHEGWQLLQLATQDLGELNRDFIPRCGSGGVEPVGDKTPTARLVESLPFFAPWEGGGPDHNRELIDLANKLRDGGSIAWETLFRWQELSQLRNDLDLLPESEPASAGASNGEMTVVETIQDRLKGQQFKLFKYLTERSRNTARYDTIRQDERLHDAFQKSAPTDDAIRKALKRLKNTLEEFEDTLPWTEMTVGNEYVELKIREGQI